MTGKDAGASVRKFAEDFKAFAMKGNVIDLAIGVIVGGAFGKIVTSLVSDMLMPVIGLITGGIDLSGSFIALDGASYASLDAATQAGAPLLKYGAFLQNVIDFLLVALCIFMVMRAMHRFLSKPAPPAPEPPRCPYCKQEVAQDATRCPHCTSELPAPAEQTPAAAG